MTIASLLLLAFAPLTVAAALGALLLPRIRAEMRFRQRLAELATPGSASKSTPKSGRGVTERSVREMLREVEAMAGRRRGNALVQRLRHAGLDISAARFYGVSALAGLGGIILLVLAGQGLAVAVLGGVALGWGAPMLFLSFRIRQRTRTMEDQFPDAMDTIVRGVRTGLPLVDCLRAISVEGPDPLRAEFLKLMNDQQVGLSLEDAVKRFADRVPFAEARFFAIVVSIQSKTGGNLSQSLSGLSTMLRDRRQLKGKIKAMSAEAKSSAWIIGAMPVLVSVIINLVNPKFMSALFTTLTGNLVLAGCVVWMIIGILVMRSMINIEV